ncbi:MAG: mechanosensitive ion channel protein MscS [Alteromonadaceae bacterium]|jgi:small conductance mechanosensitive channel|uniref:mechanosensitive ion channel domain-containing protein n=1 Tax=Rheinheimera aquimaris TaxID=412437 RepID=UPI000C5278D2|nr:mechanosensitive ion channel domain-containing protein [Rheinheimera aquimaris]MBJ91860.1 mechanosensitive ion channel protein MscS [Alteromonadaceae bacterium]HBN89600.1 mechanosensitive ion channel protein MscS [Rheinheimera sp.]
MKLLLIVVLLICLPAYSQLGSVQDDVPEDTPIRVECTTGDKAITARLLAITSAISGMEKITANTESGVLTLSGEVANAQLKGEALAIARRLDGVVYVQDMLQEQLAVRSRLAPAAEKFEQMLTKAVQMLPLLVLALLAVLCFSWLGGWLARHSTWLRRFGLTELASNLGVRFIRVLVTGIGVLIALELLDATALVSAALGVAGVIGIALGFAFRNIVENYLAGVLLSTRNPFAIGDQIQVGDFTGSVVRLTSRDTVLMTYDGNHLRIPNSDIITLAMTNFSRNPLRRFQFDVGVSVTLDLVQVRQLGIATLTNMPGILADPPPRCLINELGDSAVALKFFGWIDQRNTDFLKARSEAIRLVKLAFDDAGIEMPEPIYRIHMADINNAEPPAPTETTTSSQQAARQDVDVTTDDTMQQQLQTELRTSDEENLLTKHSNSKS